MVSLVKPFLKLCLPYTRGLVEREREDEGANLHTPKDWYRERKKVPTSTLQKIGRERGGRKMPRHL